MGNISAAIKRGEIRQDIEDLNEAVIRLRARFEEIDKINMSDTILLSTVSTNIHDALHDIRHASGALNIRLNGLDGSRK